MAAKRPNNAPEAPYTGVIQPEAPDSTAQSIMPVPPANPETAYSARNDQCPIMRSSTGPTHHSVSMLNRMCHNEFG